MDTTLAAITREDRGKNKARRLRRSGYIPAVCYGNGSQESVPLAVDPKALLQIMRSESGVNTLIDLNVNGDITRVLVKEFQLDPIHGELLHVDFYKLALDKVITVTVPVMLKGEPEGVKQQGGVLDFVQRNVQLKCMPTEIPEHIEVEVSTLMIGQGIRLRDLLTDVAWESVSDPDTLLVHVIAPKVEEEPEEEVEEATEALAGEGEPEVIKKGKVEADEESAEK